MKNIAHIESWWQKDGHFNMNHYLNVLREKNERLYNNIQSQGKDMDKGHGQPRKQLSRHTTRIMQEINSIYGKD
jgi:hypothetical protein